MVDFDSVVGLVTETKRFFLTPPEAYETYKKGEFNYVTQVDIDIQEFLKSGLLELYPQIGFVAEEQKGYAFDAGKPAWILDPLDGTTNFMHGFRQSAVSLALYDNGGIEFGVVYNPFSGEVFTAQKGRGAFLNGSPMHASKVDTISGSLVSFGTTPYSKSGSSPDFELFHRVFLDCQDIRRSGSAALDIAYVACGRTEAFFERSLSPWDYAAGIVLLREAGGAITDWRGNPPTVAAPCGILATNSLLHPYFLELLGE